VTLEISALRTEERRIISGLIRELRLEIKLDKVTKKLSVEKSPGGFSVKCRSGMRV